jgi:2'-5' RNA ligase superfamily
MKQNVIAYWLLPAQSEREFFTGKIRELAKRFDGPVFPPHLTLFVAPENARAPATVLGALGAIELVLKVGEVDHSAKFTKTLFVRFENPAALEQLCEAVRQRAAAADPCNLDPHLSLLYKQLPEDARRALVEEIELPFREVHFDAVCAVRCASPTQTADDVRAWQLVATQNSSTR